MAMCVVVPFRLPVPRFLSALEATRASDRSIRTGHPVWFPAGVWGRSPQELLFVQPAAFRASAMLPGTLAQATASTAATSNGIAALLRAHVRNPGIALDLSWVREARFTNRAATERRAATLPARRSVKKAWQAAWLLRAITCIDLTTLLGDDTPGTVRRLCAKARQPVRQDILEMLGAANLPITVGAVCVYHQLVAPAVEALDGSGIPGAAVSTGFPSGQMPFETRLAAIGASIAAGASEIDIVISRAHVLTGNFRGLYEEVRAFREACGERHMKTIIATG